MFYPSGPDGEGAPIKVEGNLIPPYPLHFRRILYILMYITLGEKFDPTLWTIQSSRTLWRFRWPQRCYAQTPPNQWCEGVAQPCSGDTECARYCEKGAQKLSDMANDMSCITYIRKLLSAVKCCDATSDKCGPTEQARRLKTALSQYQRANFKEGTKKLMSVVTFEAYLP